MPIRRFAKRITEFREQTKLKSAKKKADQAKKARLAFAKKMRKSRKQHAVLAAKPAKKAKDRLRARFHSAGRLGEQKRKAA